MTRYYDIKLKDKEKNYSIWYWADSFSIDKNGILRVYSEECGNVAVPLHPDYEVSVNSVDVKDEWDEN